MQYKDASSPLSFEHYGTFFAVRGSRPGKTVQMSENEVRSLCLKSREIFLQQPILLELEAPLKICGKKLSAIFDYIYFMVYFYAILCYKSILG